MVSPMYIPPLAHVLQIRQVFQILGSIFFGGGRSAGHGCFDRFFYFVGHLYLEVSLMITLLLPGSQPVQRFNELRQYGTAIS